MATKRNKNGQFVKGGGRASSSSSSAKRSKRGKASKRKGMARGGGNGLATARAEYRLQKPAKGDSVSAAIKKLQHNQGVMAHGLTVVAEEVAVHRRALVGAGLISARGAR